MWQGKAEEDCEGLRESRGGERGRFVWRLLRLMSSRLRCRPKKGQKKGGGGLSKRRGRFLGGVGKAWRHGGGSIRAEGLGSGIFIKSSGKGRKAYVWVEIGEEREHPIGTDYVDEKPYF